MKTPTLPKHTVAAGLAVALAFAGMVTAQPGPPADRGPKGPTTGPMMMHRQGMMDQMKEIDDQLLQKVESLKGASPEARIDLLEDIVTTLVKERANMHQQMRMMGPMSPDQMMDWERMQSMAGMPCMPGTEKKDDAATE